MDQKQEIGTRAGFTDLVKNEIEKRRTQPGLLVFDLIMLAVGFLFSRLHLVFGAYPLAIAFVSAAPVGVWQALVGAVIGSLGGGEIIRAILSLISVFLRILISGTQQSRGEESLQFKEPLLLRIAAATIASFVGAVYSFISEGITATVLLSGFSSTLLAAVFTFFFSFLYDSDIKFTEFLFGKNAILGKRREGKEKYAFIAFEVSLGITLLLVSLSLRELSFLGIDAAYVFSAFIALFFAKRFGAVRAMAMGFASSVGISSSYSVAFALFGLVSGLVFPFGLSFAAIAGAAAAVAFGAYSGGVVAVLSLVPELAAAITLFFPFSKAFSSEKQGADKDELLRASQDMVAAAALSCRRDSSELERLGSAMSDISSRLYAFGKHERAVSDDEIKEKLIFALRDSCAVCQHYEICKAINPAPCVEILDALADKVHRDEYVSEHAADILPGYCQNKEQLISRLSDGVAEYYREKTFKAGIGELSSEYELVSRLLSEAKETGECELEDNPELSEKLVPVLAECGIECGSVRVLGERKLRIIAAGRDSGGELISSKELKEGFEGALGVKLCSPGLYRKGELALFDATVTDLYSVKYAEKSLAAVSKEGSGDTLVSFKSSDGYFYSVIADGMGSGRAAGELSRMASDVLSKMLLASVSDNTALHILNHVIRRSKEERSVALDIFRYDLQKGEGVFIKSGAAVSYVKRGASLFRVRSETAPLGLMKRIDSERVRVEVKPGDLVIMMSDGVADTDEARLYNAISRGADSPGELAAMILDEARLGGGGDDMSVAVIELNYA